MLGFYKNVDLSFKFGVQAFPSFSIALLLVLWPWLCGFAG